MENQLKDDDVLIFPYVSYRTWHDPRSGLIRSTWSPRLSTGYVINHNRPSLLIETHMLKDYKTRVDATYHMLKHTIAYLDEQAKEIRKINSNADREAKDLAGKDFVLSYYTSQEDSTMVIFKGVEYNIIPSELTDGIWVQFSDKPKDYELVLFDQVKEGTRVKLPEAYIVPAECQLVIERLKLHGIEFEILEEAKEYQVNTYKFSEVSFSRKPYEGRQMVQHFEVEEIEQTKMYPAGSMVIPVNQRSAKIIAHLLEPQGPDSYLRWGFFNTIFERIEYVETYVMEEMARQMIKEDPSLLEEYLQAVADRPELYSNQWAKCFWFYERTPYYDQQKDIYPIGRIMTH
jgi:hypothetical protein